MIDYCLQLQHVDAEDDTDGTGKQILRPGVVVWKANPVISSSGMKISK